MKKYLFLTLVVLCFGNKAQIMPSFSCDQSTVVPTFTFLPNTTNSLAAANQMDETVFLSCINTVVYDTLYGLGRHAIVNAGCNFKTNFGNSMILFLCFVKNTGTLTILPNAVGPPRHIYYEPNAVIANLSSTVNTIMHPCTNILIPSFSCNDVGIKLNEFSEPTLKVYPQPAMDALNLNYNIAEPSVFTRVLIYNNLGQLIQEQDVSFKERSTTLNISEIANGVYTLTLKDQAGYKISKRFVIAR